MLSAALGSDMYFGKLSLLTSWRAGTLAAGWLARFSALKYACVRNKHCFDRRLQACIKKGDGATASVIFETTAYSFENESCIKLTDGKTGTIYPRSGTADPLILMRVIALIAQTTHLDVYGVFECL